MNEALDGTRYQFRGAPVAAASPRSFAHSSFHASRFTAVACARRPEPTGRWNVLFGNSVRVSARQITLPR
jgi:hypothetical protein